MKLTEPIVFVRLSYGLPGQTRQVDSGAAASELEADKSRLKTTARLFNGAAFQSIRAQDSATKSELLRLAISIPTGFTGAYIMPRRLLDKAEALLATAKDQRDALVAAFLDGPYVEEQSSARNQLGKAFRESDYPPASELRQDFKMDWRYFSFDVPEDLPAEIRQRETAKLQDQIAQVASDCRQALREGLAKLVQHLVDRLQPEADGRRKRLSETTVENLRDFLTTVSARDITSDDAIKNLAEQARKVLGDTKADDLRTSEATATQIRAGLETVANKIGELVRTEGGRKIDLSDEGDNSHV